MAEENNVSKRKEYVTYLLSLKRKRQALWAAIDGKTELNKTEKKEIQEDPKIRGAWLARRYKQLQQNISRNKCSEKKRLEYEAELLAIRKELNIN